MSGTKKLEEWIKIQLELLANDEETYVSKYSVRYLFALIALVRLLVLTPPSRHC